MTDPQAHPTLIRTAGPAVSQRLTRSWSLPPDLLAEAVRRLRIAALLYALGYSLAALLQPFLFADVRAKFFNQPVRWIAPALSIGGALALAAIAWHPRVSPRVKVRAGLAFEVFGSFGIAAIQYQSIAEPIRYLDLGTWDFGLSWVAVWVLLCSAMVPTPPRVTLWLAALSLTSVPLTYAAFIAAGVNPPLPATQFFFSLVFPYLVVLVIAYSVSSVVYGLGAEVRKARELGSYRLAERLGSGGMGEVWRAEHRMLARPAAIKLIRPEVLGATRDDSRNALRRFEREAQATALLQSPHTVELYDFGRADDGTFYYVMELLDGFDLNELVERFGPLPPERALCLLRQVCASLAEAHEAGLVHRDIKPANVYACRHGREVDFVKVLDFGLVKHGGALAEDADRLSAENLGAGGTPAYMSPEQAVGDEHLDGRADLYSVGCLAYWLLTGTAVFTGRTPIETMMKHVHTPPDPPSSRTSQPIPRELEAIVLLCLAKEPGARPQTADHLAEMLAGVPTPGEWTLARARQWWDTHRPPTIGRYPRPTGRDASG
ncbi:MAG TPA: serine/threonine-protein kinase [Gemmatimonadales bacterium]|nr:serine/threonine-protein kinase [Gemmatimonadales bacterium]